MDDWCLHRGDREDPVPLKYGPPTVTDVELELIAAVPAVLFEF